MISLFGAKLQPIFAQQDSVAYRMGLIVGCIFMVIVVLVVIRKMFKE
jgi:hypothetical protein